MLVGMTNSGCRVGSSGTDIVRVSLQCRSVHIQAGGGTSELVEVLPSHSADMENSADMKDSAGMEDSADMTDFAGSELDMVHGTHECLSDDTRSGSVRTDVGSQTRKLVEVPRSRSADMRRSADTPRSVDTLNAR